MKKILALIIIITISIPLFAALEGETSATVNLALDPSASSRFEMGFSGGEVNTMYDSPSGIEGNRIELQTSLSDDGTTINGLSEVAWVYWKYISVSSVDISLTIEDALQGGGDTIPLTVSIKDGTDSITSGDDRSLLIGSTATNTLPSVGSRNLRIEASVPVDDFHAVEYSTRLILTMKVS